MEFLKYYVLPFLLVCSAVFLILVVLVQRGRGGGLAGAFGGMGGQSAFGTKAGDLFTRITIGVAAVWILLCALSVKLYSVDDSPVPGGTGLPSAPRGGNVPAKGSAPGRSAPEPVSKGGPASRSAQTPAGSGAGQSQPPASPAKK
jgi:preprotein translocase subunit SecG